MAIKVEDRGAEYPQLNHEATVHKFLAGGVGIPFMHGFYEEGDYNYMISDRLGPSLQDLLNFCNDKFSLKTVLMIADQLISRIEYVHEKSFIHRDIKPENFLAGIGKRGNQFFVVDLGLAKRYRHPQSHFHIPYRQKTA